MLPQESPSVIQDRPFHPNTLHPSKLAALAKDRVCKYRNLWGHITIKPWCNEPTEWRQSEWNISVHIESKSIHASLLFLLKYYCNVIWKAKVCKSEFFTVHSRLVSSTCKCYQNILIRLRNWYVHRKKNQDTRGSVQHKKKEKNMVCRKIFWGKKPHKFQEIYFENESRGIKNRMKWLKGQLLCRLALRSWQRTSVTGISLKTEITAASRSCQPRRHKVS